MTGPSLDQPHGNAAWRLALRPANQLRLRALAHFWGWPKWGRVAALVAPLAAAYSGWIALMPQPVTLTTVAALSERVEFTVTNPEQAVVPISGMKVAPEQTGALEGCVKGALRPREHSVIAYERPIVGDMAVALVRGGGHLEFPDGRQTALPDSVEFVAVQECQSQGAPPRFPIWGKLSLGSEKITADGAGRVAPNMLLEGRLVVQAQALKTALLPFHKSTLYSVAEIALPVGARVESGAADERKLLWWGSAYIDPQKVALQIQAATEAPSLRLFRPGRTDANDADVISISALTQLFSDPNMVRVQALFAALLGLIGGVASLVGKRPE